MTDTVFADHVVVGAGTAGCVLARRLLESAGGTVLVLDAGTSPDGLPSCTDPARWVENIGAAHDWSYVYGPEPQLDDRRMLLSRGRVLGGSGSTNALVWVRGDRAVYDGWAAAGATGWGWDDVLPYFRRTEDAAGSGPGRGTGGPVRVERVRDLHPVAEALVAAGVGYGMPYLPDVDTDRPLGAGPITMAASGGVRTSTWTGHLRPVVDDERLTLVTGAHVTSLTLTGSRCTGVGYRSGDGAEVEVRAGRAVVLCAGAVGSPRLLMESGIGPAGHLRSVGVRPVHDLPGVGANLQEHPIVAALCYEAAGPLPPLRDNLEGSMAFWRSGPDVGVPDLTFVAVQIPYVSPEIAAAYPLPARAFCLAPGVMSVRSRGWVRLTGADPGGRLDVRSNMLADPADLDAAVAGVEIGLELAEQPAFRALAARRVVPGPDTGRASLAAFARRAAMPYFHTSGTCAMGTHEQAVVDPGLRVHGLDGLYVADASVMPTITSANTNAPTAMIAEKAADLIAAA